MDFTELGMKVPNEYLDDVKNIVIDIVRAKIKEKHTSTAVKAVVVQDAIEADILAFNTENKLTVEL